MNEAIINWEKDSGQTRSNSNLQRAIRRLQYFQRVSSLESKFDESKAKELLHDPEIEAFGVKKGDIFCILFKEFANRKQMDLCLAVYKTTIHADIHPPNICQPML